MGKLLWIYTTLLAIHTNFIHISYAEGGCWWGQCYDLYTGDALLRSRSGHFEAFMLDKFL